MTELDPAVRKLLQVCHHLAPLDKGLKLARALKIVLPDVKKCDRGRVLSDVPRDRDDIDPRAVEAWDNLINRVRETERWAERPADDRKDLGTMVGHQGAYLRELVARINDIDERMAVALGLRVGRDS